MPASHGQHFTIAHFTSAGTAVCNMYQTTVADPEVHARRQCWTKVGAIDATALGPFKK